MRPGPDPVNRPAMAAARAALDAVTAEQEAELLARAIDISELVPRVLPASWIDQSHQRDVAWPFQALYQHARAPMRVIVTAMRELDERRWLHVSVAHRQRMPNWDDLREVKDLFIGRDKTALQVLPPTEQHVNVHQFCLHLWHCLDGDVTPDFRHGGLI